MQKTWRKTHLQAVERRVHGQELPPAHRGEGARVGGEPSSRSTAPHPHTPSSPSEGERIHCTGRESTRLQRSPSVAHSCSCC